MKAARDVGILAASAFLPGFRRSRFRAASAHVGLLMRRAALSQPAACASNVAPNHPSRCYHKLLAPWRLMP